MAELPTFDTKTYFEGLLDDKKPPAWLSDAVRPCYEAARKAVHIHGYYHQPTTVNDTTGSVLSLSPYGDGMNELQMEFFPLPNQGVQISFLLTDDSPNRPLDVRSATLYEVYALAQLRASRSEMAKVLASSLHDFVVSPLHC